MDEIRSRDPREAADLVRGKAQLLAPGLLEDELALALIERPAQGSRDPRCRQIQQGSGDGPEIEGIASIDLPGLVVVRDRGERSISRAVIELERDIRDVAIVGAQIIGLDRAGDVVGVKHGATTEDVRLAGSWNDVIVSGGVHPIAISSQVRAEFIGGLPQQPQPPSVVLIRVGLAVEVGVLQKAGGVVEIERGAILQCAGIVDRAADGHLGLLGQAVAQAELAVTFKMIGRFGGVNDDRAADGVAPVEGALRTLEHLDLRDVEQLLVELVRIGLQHAVDQHGD